MNNLQMDFSIENLKLSLHGKSEDCHINSFLVAQALKKRGHEVKLITGIYSNPPKNIKHSWLEFKDKILETDPIQLREDGDIMPNEFCAILDKNKFAHRYREVGSNDGR